MGCEETTTNAEERADCRHLRVTLQRRLEPDERIQR